MAESSGATSTSAGAVKAEVNAATFWQHARRLYTSWRTQRDSVWQSADAVLVCLGGGDDDETPYRKTLALSGWLFGQVFRDTVLLLTADTLLVATGPNKARALAAVNEHTPADAAADGGEPYPKLRVLTRTKAEQSSVVAALVDAARASHAGARLGAVPKDNGDLPSGDGAPLAGAAWQALRKAINGGGGGGGGDESTSAALVDVSPALAALFARKDEAERKLARNASRLSSAIMKRVLVSKIEDVIQEERRVSHEKISDDVYAVFDDVSTTFPKLANPENVEACYPPIVQSGGRYDVRPSAQPDEHRFEYEYGTVLLSLGARFKLYCSTLSRTLFVDAHDAQREAYAAVLAAHDALVKACRVGARLCDVYAAARAALAAAKGGDALVPLMTKTCGFGMGLEFKESTMLINAKNETRIEEGMVFSLSVAVQNIPHPRAAETGVPSAARQPYAILIADTVQVLAGDAGAEVMTTEPKKDWDTVSYSLNDGDDDDGDGDGDDDDAKAEADERARRRSKIAAAAKAKLESSAMPQKRSSRRAEQNAAEMAKQQAAAEKRRLHQAELARKKRLEWQGKTQAGGAKKSTENKGKDLLRVASYSSPADFPRDVQLGKLHVDVRAETVIVPVYGTMVPFHISMIKSESKNDDYLRINFSTPAAMGADAAKMSAAGGKNAVYLRELLYRCADAREVANALRMIKELRKRVTQRDAMAADVRSLVQQEDLQVARGGRNPRLVDLFIRPNIAGRRTMGSIEAHTNGLRFSSTKGATVDIIYSNIRHAFFQPAENELIVLIHFFLHNEIMIGKKKTLHVQFYTEVMEMSQSLDHASKRGGDADEIEDEYREKMMRIKLNETFKKFAHRVEEATNSKLEFDIPYRELGFYGVATRSNVLLQPSAYCLVHLVEPPWFVLPLDEVEIVSFERVNRSFNLKNFDMVIVFKDLRKPTQSITTVPTDSLEVIKEWLDGCNILYYETPTNLNWNNIMKTINADLEGFWEDGGWSIFLGDGHGDGDDGDASGDGDDDDSEEESDAEFAPSELSDADDESDDSFDSDEDFSAEEDDSDDDAGDDDSDDDDDDEEEEEESEDSEEERERLRRERKRKQQSSSSSSDHKRGRR